MTSSRSRACVFIDSSDPRVRNQLMTNTVSHPFIRPKFPPSINLRDLITKQVYADSNKNNSGRAPNAFIIYRKLFVETARNDGYQLPMTVVSSMASQSWDLEPEMVKEEYKRLAKEANSIRNELIPKATRRKKREKWNIVSFTPSSSSVGSPSTPLANNNPAVKSKSTAKRKQLKVKPLKEIEFLTEPVPPCEFDHPKITFDIPYDIVSPIIDRFLDSDPEFDTHCPSLDVSTNSPTYDNQQQQQQQPPINNDEVNWQRELVYPNFNFDISPEFYNQESIIGEDNTFDIQFDAAIDFPVPNYEYDSLGYLLIFDNPENSYPSF